MPKPRGPEHQRAPSLARRLDQRSSAKARALETKTANDLALHASPDPDGLTFYHQSGVVTWRGKRLNVSPAQFRMIEFLIHKRDLHISPRRWEEKFGQSVEACGSAIIKIFRKVDPEFDRVVLRPGLGIIWEVPDHA